MSINLFVDLNIEGLDDALAGPAPSSLSKLVGEDALIAFLTTAARAESLKVMRKNPIAEETLRQVFGPFEAATGLDPEKDLLPLISGKVTGALYLQDARQAFAAAQRGRMSLNQLLDIIRASVTAEVKDREGMLALLDRSVSALEARGARFNRTESERNGKPLVRFEPDRPEPTLAWALYGEDYVYAAGKGFLDEMLDVIDGKAKAMDLAGGPAEKMVAQEGASVLVFRVCKLE